MAELVFLGGEDLVKLLKDIPKNLTNSAIKAASRKAARPIANEARMRLKTAPEFKRTGTDDGFSKLLAVAKSVKVVSWKNHVNVQIDNRAPSIPVKGSKRPFWTMYGWARLLAQGRRWTANSSTSRRSFNTGTTLGAGDFVEDASDSESANRIFAESIEDELAKAIDKSFRRHGKR